jgi:hypothetical protein
MKGCEIRSKGEGRRKRLLAVEVKKTGSAVGKAGGCIEKVAARRKKGEKGE